MVLSLVPLWHYRVIYLKCLHIIVELYGGMTVPILHLTSIVCGKTEDYTGKDDVYITVKGKTVWEDRMDTSRPDNAKSIGTEHPFTRKARIDLWEEDSGNWDDDDHLGRTYAYAEQADKGEQYYTLGAVVQNTDLPTK
jgi:hypothetical protein